MKQPTPVIARRVDATELDIWDDDSHLRDSTIVKEVENVAFENAEQQAKPSPLTARMFLLYLCLLIATLNSCINGYDGSLMSGINAYEQYRRYFGFELEGGAPATGLVFAIYTIGNTIGSFVAGPAADWKGRKWGMFIGSVIIVLGTCVQATCTNIEGFMSGRFILGFGVAICAAAGPAYVSEMAHPSYRGVMTGVYNTFWYIGAIPGTFVPYATSGIRDDHSWRIPTWCQLFFAGIVVCASPFLPETPRWLIANDRHEEALNVMAKYHGEGDRESPIVQLEYKEMVEDISVTGADKRWWDYRELFNTREVRYRTMLVTAMAFFGQWSGMGPISYYYPALLKNAGFSDKRMTLFFNGVNNVVSFAGAIIGAIFTDKWGRRPQLLTCTAIMACLYLIVLVLSATNQRIGPEGVMLDEKKTPLIKNKAQGRAIMAMIFIFAFVYSAGYTPLQALYPVECLRYESRAKGMGFLNFWVNIANFYNTFVTEIAFTRVRWKYYFLFIFWDIFEFIFIYFFFVETKRRTLEELTDIFRAKSPVKASLARVQVVLHDDHVTELLEKETRV